VNNSITYNATQKYPNIIARTSNYIGKSNLSTDPSFNGFIDDFRVYNRTLTADDVGILYNSANGFQNTSTNMKQISTYNIVDPSCLSMYLPFENDYYDYQGGYQINTSTYYINNNANTSFTSSLYAVGSASLNLSANGYLNVNQYVNQNLINDIPFGTISVWVFLKSYGAYTITSKQRNGVNTYAVLSIGYSVTTGGAYAAGTAGYIYWHGSNTTASAASASSISLNVWHLITVNFDASGCSIYVDGSFNKFTSGDYSIPYDTTADSCYIGYWSGGGTYFNGYIDDFRLYRRELTSTEILNLYN
jgi:hypothetical protein